MKYRKKELQSYNCKVIFFNVMNMSENRHNNYLGAVWALCHNLWNVPSAIFWRKHNIIKGGVILLKMAMRKLMLHSFYLIFLHAVFISFFASLALLLLLSPPYRDYFICFCLFVYFGLVSVSCLPDIQTHMWREVWRVTVYNTWCTRWWWWSTSFWCIPVSTPECCSVPVSAALWWENQWFWCMMRKLMRKVTEEASDNSFINQRSQVVC